ncbi:MAG TPA: PilZ domain-containing protein [Allosphingosinicella sp.]|nr:PilZ domain-containing protein [Allosphingosinicella sp.]
MRPHTPIATKQPKKAQASLGSLTAIPVKREESRLSNERREERHRDILSGALIYFRRRKYEVTVINVSAGGAMVEAQIEPRIGEQIEIQFGDCNRTKCAVRWVRGTRIGLEFQQETTIIGSSSIQDFIIRRLRGDEGEAEPAEKDTKASRAARHGLIWTGTLHCNHDSVPARLRNISAEGAMVETSQSFAVGAEVFLDLDEGGTAFAKVAWSEGGQMGLKFDQKFDLKQLARSKPAPVAAAPTVKPQYLESDGSPDSPWSAMWDRLTPQELKAQLAKSRIRKR